VLNKQIVLHTGTIVDGYFLCKDWDYLMCRTKIVAETDTETIQKCVYPDKRGVHRTATIGGHRKSIRQLTALLEFDVLEED
jgi:hypothetical protein